MKRVRNPLVLRALLEGNDIAEQIQWVENAERYGFDAREWLSEPGNVALRLGEDLAMFEYLGPGVYQGHIFFASRGSAAETKARLMIAEMMTMGAHTIRGEIPVYRKDVRQFMARIGFDFAGHAIRPMGKVVLATINNPSSFETMAKEAVPLATA